MSKTFGSTTAFAIEAAYIGTSGKWIYAHLRVWVAGTPIGDFEDSADLPSSARWGRTFLGASAKRTRSEFDLMPTDAVFEFFYGRHVTTIQAPPRPYVGFWDRDPYVFDEVGESSLRDNLAIVVVRRGDGLDRVIVRPFVEDTLTETALGGGTLDRVVDAYCSWVEGIATN